jgi:predicted RNA-binding Zn ribbon-like protein
MSVTQAAPGELEAVQAFVNTRDLEDGREDLTSAAALTSWLADRELLGHDETAEEGDLERALAVREALRALLVANAGGPLSSGAAATLDGAARRAGLLARFAADGAARLEPSATGVDAAVGRLLARVHAAMATGTWSRLKACADPGCHWAFYDHSRNHSGVWCSMAVCGNRAKARAYRRRRAHG